MVTIWCRQIGTKRISLYDGTDVSDYRARRDDLNLINSDRRIMSFYGNWDVGTTRFPSKWRSFQGTRNPTVSRPHVSDYDTDFND